MLAERPTDAGGPSQLDGIVEFHDRFEVTEAESPLVQVACALSFRMPDGQERGASPQAWHEELTWRQVIRKCASPSASCWMDSRSLSCLPPGR
jgi:hypothetical protein